MDLQQIVSQTEGERQQDIQDQLNNDILNNTQLSEERTEELKQRVRNLLEPIGQEVFRISGERLLQKYGIKKYYDALKKGDTSALVDAATSDLKSRGQQFIEGKADDLMRRNGFSEDDISNVKNAFKSGDFSNVSTNKLKGLFDNAESLQQNVDVRKALKNQGLNDEDVDDLTSTNFFSSLKRIPDILNKGLASASEKFQNLTDSARSAFQKRIQDKQLPEDIDPENMSDTLLQLGANRAGSIKFLSSSFTKKKPTTEEPEDPSSIQMGELPEFTSSTGLKALTTVPDEEWEAYLQREAAAPTDFGRLAAQRELQPQTDPESIATLDRLFTQSQLPLTAGQRELVERVGLTEEQARAVPQATDEPSLKGGLGGEGEGIPFDPDAEDAKVASFRPTITEEPQEGLVSRLVNFFRGNPQEEPQIGPSREVLFAARPERGVFDTSKIPDFRSAREFEEQFNNTFRDVKSNPTYANILRDEEYPQFRVRQVGGFDTSATRPDTIPSSTFDVPTFTRSQVIQQQIASGERPDPAKFVKPTEDEVRGGSYSRGGFKVQAPARSTTQKEDADRADLERAFGKESGTTETTLPPPPPAPSGVSESSPSVFSGTTVTSYAPTPLTPQAPQQRALPPSDPTTGTDPIQEAGGITAGTGATLAGGNKMRNYFKNRRNRGNKQRQKKENQEEDAENSKQDTPQEEQPQAFDNVDDYAPLTDDEEEDPAKAEAEGRPVEGEEAPEPEERSSDPTQDAPSEEPSEPPEQPEPSEPPSAEPEPEDAPEVSTEATEGTEAVTEGTEAATEAATTAATTATTAATEGGAAATTLTTLGAGEAASNGFLNPILDGIGLVTGIAGILMGSGIFSKKPPTPPSASEVSANPEKYGLPTAPITSTVAETFGGGQL